MMIFFHVSDLLVQLCIVPFCRFQCIFNRFNLFAHSFNLCLFESVSVPEEIAVEIVLRGEAFHVINYESLCMVHDEVIL